MKNAATDEHGWTRIKQNEDEEAWEVHAVEIK
jgi:hypothetical protein